MNAVVDYKDPALPAPVARRGVTEAQWRTMMNLFPGAKGESVLMVWDYCVARSLDPLKKPCHIVPMDVNGTWRDVVMPGIYELRTTAMRTGQYMGHSKPEYGPEIEHKGVKAPEWCSITIYRWNAAAAQRCEFPVQVYFSESVGTRWDKESKSHKVNARWTKAPRQMLTKCTEAAGLREAFPDELGGQHAAEEMEGQSVSQTEDTVITRSTGVNPRGDLSGVDWEMRDKHVEQIKKLIDEYGSDEGVMGSMYRGYIEAENLQQFQELWITIEDKLVADEVVNRATMKKWMKSEPIHQRPNGRP